VRGRLIDWLRRHVWTTSILIGLGCVLVMYVATTLLGVMAPDVENARWAGRATAPTEKSIAVLLKELAVRALAVPFAETLLMFALPAVLFRGLAKSPLTYVIAIGGLGWLVHGAGLHQIPHGMNFAILALWYWSVTTWRGWGQAVLATTLAHGVWNAAFMLFWFVS
jgi:hypothetical protein